MPILQGKAYYCYHNRPDTGKAGAGWTPKWKISLHLDTKEALAEAKDLGMEIKPATKVIPGEYVNISRNVTTKAGDSQDPPEVVDSKLNPWPPKMIIGQGSTVKVRFGIYQGTQFKRTFTDLQKIQVIDFVPWEAEDLKPVEDGFELSDEELFDGAEEEATTA